MATSTDLRAAIEEIKDHFPEKAAEEILEHERDWTRRLEERIGSLPWWVISTIVHGALLLLVTLLAVAMPGPKPDSVVITIDRPRDPVPPIPDPTPKRPLFGIPSPEEPTERPSLPSFVKPTDDITTFDSLSDIERDKPLGTDDKLADIPLGGMTKNGSIGVGELGMGGRFGYRDGGGRKRAAGRLGGSPQTESAVELALAWLARHQEPDGHWDCAKYEGTYPGAAGDIADTGLALLAFLGAGYTDRTGRYADNVKRAEQWLIGQQQPNGCLSARHGGLGVGYAHAIAGLALAEAYGMGEDRAVGEAAQKAVDYSINEHQCPYSGWRYSPKEKADLSVSGWFVMQLKSAIVAGLKVDGSGLQGAAAFLDSVSDGKGGAGYMGPQMKVSTTAIGMVCREFMGAAQADPQVIGAGRILSEDKNLPKWGAGDRLDFYYIYYGTLGMFQLGGDGWKKWNEAMKSALVDNQCRSGATDGSVTDKDGSWDPYGANGRKGGRVFQTATGALSLEVYYRYLRAYER